MKLPPRIAAAISGMATYRIHPKNHAAGRLAVRRGDWWFIALTVISPRRANLILDVERERRHDLFVKLGATPWQLHVIDQLYDHEAEPLT